MFEKAYFFSCKIVSNFSRNTLDLDADAMHGSYTHLPPFLAKKFDKSDRV